MRTLTSVPTLVESPFIIVKIGDFTFGNVSKTRSGNTLNVTFPEYMKSVEVVKINGEVNTYTIQLEYPITKGRDPNLIDYVFSSVSSSRKLIISYGDWNSPSFIYKEEECLITNVRSNVDFNSPKITYTISCVSDAKGLQSINYTFGPKTKRKPSDIILNELLFNPEYGFSDIFTGMSTRAKVIEYGLIASDDKPVDIPAKANCSPWDYLTYVIGFMIPEDTPSNVITGTGFYRLSVIDDNKNELNGSYFKVTKVSTQSNVVIDDTTTNSVIDMGSYELDVGYPTNNFVTSFSLDNDEQWSILYNTANKANVRNYSYKITSTGQLKRDYSPTLTRISTWEGTTAADKSWWTSVTQFPLKATITLKGLVRPTMLMSYVKLNVVFYGQKHISSGYYIIEKQTDRVDGSGYKTTLNLLRVKGDTISEKEVTVRNNKTDPATGFNLANNSGNGVSWDTDGKTTFRQQADEFYGVDRFTPIDRSKANDFYNISRFNPVNKDNDFYNTSRFNDTNTQSNKRTQTSTSFNSGIQTPDMNNTSTKKKGGLSQR